MTNLEDEFQKLIDAMHQSVEQKKVNGELSLDDAKLLLDMIDSRISKPAVISGIHEGWSASSIECGYQNDPEYLDDMWISSTGECVEAAKAFDDMCKEQDK